MIEEKNKTIVTTYELKEMINLFISKRVYTEDCSDITQVNKNDYLKLREITHLLIDAHWERNCDGDLPIDFILIDKNKSRRTLTPTITWEEDNPTIYTVEKALSDVVNYQRQNKSNLE